MTNFAERIAYWYLRLQGFLLIEDYVLHRGEQIKRTADHDLVGIRLKHSEEEIDECILLPDPDLKRQLSDLRRNVAVIVQVKSGRHRSASKAFRTERLLYAIRILGVAPRDSAKRIASLLSEKPKVELSHDWTVAKLLITDRSGNQEALSVPLENALNFIVGRLKSHPVRKHLDRMFFHDELMQLLAWSVRSEAKLGAHEQRSQRVALAQALWH